MITEHARHQLFTRFEEHLGSGRAATLICPLPPVGGGEGVARRHLGEQFRDLHREIDLLRHELREFEWRLGNSIDRKLDAKLGQFRAELLRTLGTWLFASQAAVIAAVSMIVALD